jgi:L-ascorbate metabolism protein UlaG (beta-lactamase superfamily)
MQGEHMRLLAALLMLACTSLASAQEVVLTYVGNEGVLVAEGEKKVLIDALYRQAMEPYINHSAKRLHSLETGSEEFAGVDIVLTTHRHADHFDGAAVAEHLKNNPGARFAAAEEVADRALTAGAEPTRVIAANQKGPRSFRHGGIEVEFVPLFHDRAPSATAPAKWEPQNMGFIVKLGGLRILHVGDAGGSRENLESLCSSCAGVDVALVPFWYLMSDDTTRLITNQLKPKRIVLIHVPPADSEIAIELARRVPGTLAFTAPGQQVTLSSAPQKAGD